MNNGYFSFGSSVNAQVRAMIHPKIVHPKNRLSAKMAFQFFFPIAIMIGMKYMAIIEISVGRCITNFIESDVIKFLLSPLKTDGACGVRLEVTGSDCLRKAKDSVTFAFIE